MPTSNFKQKYQATACLDSHLNKKICYFRGIARLLEAIHIVSQ